MKKKRKAKDPEKVKQGRRSRTKGHNFERQMANVLTEIWPNARRGYQARDSVKEAKAPDVDGTPLYIECKKGKATNPKAGWRQANEHTDGRPPVCISRDDRKEILVTMEMDLFMHLMRIYEQHKDQ